MAEAFGYQYYTIDTIDDFITSPTQGILEVFMSPNQEFIPKVKGIKNSDNTIQAGLLEEMSPLLPIEEIESVMISGINQRSTGMNR